MNTTIDTRIVRNKSITMLLAVAVSVLLPQLFHAVGAVSGLGAALGSTFLPMHLPVPVSYTHLDVYKRQAQ